MARPRRIRLTVPLRVSFVAGTTRGQGAVYDISREGFFLRSPVLAKEGSPIQAEVTGPSGAKFTVKGTVRWNTFHVPGRDNTSGFGVHVTWCGGAYDGFVEGVFAAGAEADDS